MHTRVTLERVGMHVTVAIPLDVAERHRLGPGDEVFMLEAPLGVLLTRYDPVTAGQLEAYRRILDENRETLAALAER